MGYSEIEIKKLNCLSDAVSDSINSRIDELNSNARLNYSMRQGLEEKQKFTQIQIEKLQKTIGKYEGSLAEYVQAAIVEDFYYFDGIPNDNSTSFIRNFVSGGIYEEDIEEIDIDEESELFGFEDFIMHSEKDYSHIYEFIEGIALASTYNAFVSIQRQEKEETEENEENIKENIYDQYLPKSNKSLIFCGKRLNLTERIKIANEVLNFEGQIRKLNILDTEKYQLMAYILGNDVSNVRNVINGTRPNKIKEKELNTYLKDLMK